MYLELESLNNKKVYYLLAQCYIYSNNSERANYYLNLAENISMSEYMYLKIKLLIN